MHDPDPDGRLISLPQGVLALIWHYLPQSSRNSLYRSCRGIQPLLNPQSMSVELRSSTGDVCEGRFMALHPSTKVQQVKLSKGASSPEAGPDCSIVSFFCSSIAMNVHQPWADVRNLNLEVRTAPFVEMEDAL